MSAELSPYTEFMPATPPPAPTPKSVKVQLTAGTGVDIDWADGHASHYSFQFLRDACPCALCDEERHNEGREPGEAHRAKYWREMVQHYF